MKTVTVKVTVTVIKWCPFREIEILLLNGKKPQTTRETNINALIKKKKNW